jgi:hypothetical protein
VRSARAERRWAPSLVVDLPHASRRVGEGNLAETFRTKVQALQPARGAHKVAAILGGIVR